MDYVITIDGKDHALATPTLSVRRAGFAVAKERDPERKLVLKHEYLGLALGEQERDAILGPLDTCDTARLSALCTDVMSVYDIPEGKAAAASVKALADSMAPALDTLTKVTLAVERVKELSALTQA